MSFKYETIYNDLHKAISSGVFLPSEKLPSLRKSSQKYNCAISVVIQAYNKLESIGLIQSVEKSGYRVSFSKSSILPTPELENHSLKPSMSRADIMTSRIIDMAMDNSFLPFGAAIPDQSIMATKKLIKYINRRALCSPELLCGYTTAGGSLNLRNEIVKYMFKRGVTVNTNDIIITNGCAEALYLSLKLTTKPGDTVAIETPTYFSLISMLEDLGLNAIEVPTKADTGLDINFLKKSISNQTIKSLVFSSTFQNPLCSVMSQNDLKELYNLSVTNKFTLIEDDIYGDCNFEKSNNTPLKAMDIDRSVIYCSSFSKTLSSGLRIGWVIPGRLSEDFKNSKQLSGLGGPALLQEAFADYFSDGCYDLHLKSFRKKIYAQTYGTKKLIEQNFPDGFKITSPKGGYFLWIEFPKKLDSYKLYTLAYQEKIGIVPGPVFSTSGRYKNCIRISCASPITPNIVDGIKKLGELVKLCLDL